MASKLGFLHQIFHMDCCHAGGLFSAGARDVGDHEFVLAKSQKPCVIGISAVTQDEKALELDGHGMPVRELPASASRLFLAPPISRLARLQRSLMCELLV